MARRPRIVFAGGIYHVTFRGNERKNIFSDEHDYKRFLSSLAERVSTYRIRLYMYTLMPNHVHLLLETPLINLSTFLGSLLTSYATYFNKRHERAGHLTQNRYYSVLVSGDIYLLRLSRYIHLNPVYAKSMRNLALNVRLAYLNDYKWSSFRAYSGLSEKEAFVDYGPILAMMPGRTTFKRLKYRKYIETGLAEADDEFQKLIHNSPLAIGPTGFIKDVRHQYHDRANQIKMEDVAFRKNTSSVLPEAIINAVCQEYKIAESDLKKHKINDWIKPVTAMLLTQVSGLTQRKIAEYLGLKTGAAVCLQLKRFRQCTFEKPRKIFSRLLKVFNI